MMQLDLKKRVAELVSNILSPFVVCTIVVILVSLRVTTSLAAALKWSLISLGLSILPVFLIILYLVSSDRLESVFINVRRQRHKIYLLSGIFSVISCVVLYYLGAPRVLVAEFVAGLVAVIVFMGINLWWKISVHTAFAASAVTILILLYGAIGAVAALLLPLIGWSRIELEHHSPTQVAIGAALAALIVIVVFSLFGLVGRGASL